MSTELHMNTSHPARRLSGDQMLWRISLSCLLSLALTSLTIGCDDDEPQSEPKAGESAGEPAGVMAGDMAGDMAGEQVRSARIQSRGPTLRTRS